MSTTYYIVDQSTNIYTLFDINAKNKLNLMIIKIFLELQIAIQMSNKMNSFSSVISLQNSSVFPIH